MRATLPHWTVVLTGLAATSLVGGTLFLERGQTPSTPPPLKRTLDVTARARADFVLRVPEKVRVASPDRKPAAGDYWLEQSVQIRVRRGRVLVAAGAPMDSFRRRLLRAAWAAGPPPSGGAFAVRLGLILGVFGLLVWLAGPLAGSRRRQALLILITAVSVTVGLGFRLYTDLPMACAPVAMGALLVALALGRRAAVLVAVATAGLAGLSDLAEGPVLVGIASAGLVAALVTLHRRTLSLVIAAAVAGVIQAGILWGVAPVVPPLGGEIEGASALGVSLLGGVGPWAAGLVSLVLAWPVLRWARVASAGRLRRLVSPRHPLLVELRRRGPGTYRHARNVAHLAEAGARAIGGDRHLLRAGAWYHDLGKLLDSEVFAENRGQTPRTEPGTKPPADPHDALSPEKSARRIARHVADGLRLARRYRLPPELRDLMAEHHGTSSIRSPLQRARREGRDIDPSVYYYPGPLPSSREAAILMVSDSVEAASRQIDDPSLAAVSEVVEEVVDRLMSEYQFEDCDLTQVELVALAEALVMTLRHTLHRRVEPAQAEPDTAQAPDTPDDPEPPEPQLQQEST